MRAVARAADPIPAGSAVCTGQASRAPVIVLAPAYCGASTLRTLLEDHPDLACTSGTGLLALCEQAMTTWRNADGRPAGPPSSLACASIRALATSVITSILAREGRPRWCETAAANPQAARTFLHLYPGTRFLCLHRACPAVIRAVLDASPWGITNPALAPFAAMYPANTVACLTAYWVTATSALLAFEDEHPQSCLRVRFEDLTRARCETAENVLTFLGLDDHAVSSEAQPQPVVECPASPVAAFPVGQIPPAMLAQANGLLQKLSYPALTAP